MVTSASTDASIHAASEWLVQRHPEPPAVGIVLGTGTDTLAERITNFKKYPYADIPNFPIGTATGHKNEFVLGNLNGIAVAAMKGRFHYYEGHSTDRVTFGIQVMHRLGVKTLFLTNAAGGVDPTMKIGDLMLIESHLDFMFQAHGSDPRYLFTGPQNARSDAAYDKDLKSKALQIARRGGFPLHRGVYVGMLGPNYETRAEYRMIRRIGGHAAGMSTVPEVRAAAQCGLKVLAVSVITNVAIPDAMRETSGEEVVAAGRLANQSLATLIEQLVQAT